MQETLLSADIDQKPNNIVYQMYVFRGEIESAQTQSVSLNYTERARFLSSGRPVCSEGDFRHTLMYQKHLSRSPTQESCAIMTMRM